MTKPRIVVMFTQTDGTLIDEFIVEPTDKHLQEFPDLTQKGLTQMIADAIQHRFECPEDNS